jgi:hypothetical protein
MYEILKTEKTLKITSLQILIEGAYGPVAVQRMTE